MLRKLSSADDSRGWEAVGRINFGRDGFCTGTLITTEIVLTAAHCLFDKATGARVDIGSIEFLAGLRNGRAAAYRGIKRVQIHPDYIFDGTLGMERVSADLALLLLDQPIRNARIKPFATTDLADRGAEVGVVSYAKDREQAASFEEICHVLARDPGILVLSCEVEHGASGSPIFIEEEGELRVVSVISAKAEWKLRPVALAAALDQQLDGLMAGLNASDGVFRRALPQANGVTTLSGESGFGAKFLKP